jgi:hypothetical protein
MVTLNITIKGHNLPEKYDTLEDAVRSIKLLARSYKRAGFIVHRISETHFNATKDGQLDTVAHITQ